MGGVCLPMAYGSSEPVGSLKEENAPGLIFGELLNTSSLASLVLRISPYRFSSHQAYEVKEFTFSLASGGMKPIPEKFRIALPKDAEVYCALLLEGRELLGEFLLFPTDCVMITLNLNTAKLVFGGPQADWLEAQAAIKEAEEFKHSLKSFPKTSKKPVQENEIGEDMLFQLNETAYADIPGWEQLVSYQASLPEERVELLRTELIGNFFGARLSKFLHIHKSLRIRTGQFSDQIQGLLASLSEKLKRDWQCLQPSLISAGYSNLLREWVKLEQLISDKPFEQVAADNFQGELLDKVLTGHLLDHIRCSAVEFGYWENYARKIITHPWKRIAASSLSSYGTGVPVKSTHNT